MYLQGDAQKAEKCTQHFTYVLYLSKLTVQDFLLFNAIFDTLFWKNIYYSKFALPK